MSRQEIFFNGLPSSILGQFLFAPVFPIQKNDILIRMRQDEMLRRNGQKGVSSGVINKVSGFRLEEAAVIEKELSARNDQRSPATARPAAVSLKVKIQKNPVFPIKRRRNRAPRRDEKNITANNQLSIRSILTRQVSNGLTAMTLTTAWSA